MSETPDEETAEVPAEAGGAPRALAPASAPLEADEPLPAGAPLPTLEPSGQRPVVIRFSARWWWDHTGRIAGALVGLFVVALLILLAAGGDSSAGAILALVVAGVLMIAVGGRIHGR